jgi:hypothetical protein
VPIEDDCHQEGIELKIKAVFEPLLHMKRLSSKAIFLSGGSTLASKYDLYSANACVVPTIASLVVVICSMPSTSTTVENALGVKYRA